MHVKPGISIRFLLGFGLGPLGLMLSLFGGNNLMNAAAKYTEAHLLGSVTGTSQSIFIATEDLRYECGGMMAPLTAFMLTDAEQHQQFRNNAELGETGSRRGPKRLATIPGLAKLTSDITAHAHAAAQPPRYVTNYIAMNVYM